MCIEAEVFLITSGLFIWLDEGEMIALEKIPESLVVSCC